MQMRIRCQETSRDYIEDDAATEDVDESEDANDHVFIISVTDGTSSIEHEFTLTVTDVDDPAPGSNQKLNVDEGVGAADGGTEVGSAPLGDVAGQYGNLQQIDNLGNITLNQDDILFGIDATTGTISLKEGKEVDFESGIVTYTLVGD